VAPFAESEDGSLEDRLTPEQAAIVDALTSNPRIIAASLLQGINPNAAHALVPDDEADGFMRSMMVAQVSAVTCDGTVPASIHDNRPGFYVNQLTSDDAEAAPDPRLELRTVEASALIMRGSCDFLAPAIADDYRQTLPNATFVAIEGAGHDLPRDQPALYKATLLAFLRDEALPAGDGLEALAHT